MCYGEHEAWSQHCLAREDKLARAKAAYATRPHYHPVPATSAISVQFRGAAGGLRCKRLARDLGNQLETETLETTGYAIRRHKRTSTRIVPDTGMDKENKVPERLSNQQP